MFGKFQRRDRPFSEIGGKYILKVRIGSRVFAPTPFAGVLTLLVMTALSSLGNWQLQRAVEKRQLMNQAEQGRVQVLPLDAQHAPTLARYQRVSLQGHYEPQQQVLLDNMPSTAPSNKGQPGYRVLTPFRLDDQSLVLVDRGWVPLGVDRRQLPVVAVDVNTRRLTGMLDELPRPGVRAGDAGVGETWPQVLNYPTLAELRRLYGPALHSRILLLDAQAADGFERTWQIDLGFSPERHVGYAIQWFGMALAVFVIFIVVNLKRIES